MSNAIEPAPSKHPDPGPLRVALAGNPNAGKTSLFNALTGARQHVGNYPGVTVERRAGSYRGADGRSVEVLDLPGTYNLSAYSPEERIAQTELLEGRPDRVVAVVDSTNLKRGLVLVVQLMQIRKGGSGLVLCLNMADEAEASGQRLDIERMRARLGFPVVQTVGHRGIGIDELRRAIEAPDRPDEGEHRLVLGEQLEAAIAAITSRLRRLDSFKDEPEGLCDWLATKLLLGEAPARERVEALGKAAQSALREADKRRAALEAHTGRDIHMFVMERYYGFVDGLLKEVTLSQAREDARILSDRVDAVLVNRVLGLPVFLVVMYLVFWMTFTLGEWPMGWIEAGFQVLGAWLSSLWPPGSPSMLRSLFVDGIVGGVGGVVAFLPNIVLLFACLAFLEDTGYMARAAFIMDRVMHRFGLHGKSFIPLMSGFGCSIPGIMATRTLEHEHDRLATMLVLPLMSCGARLTIWMLLIPAFFAPSYRAPMLWLIYVCGVALAMLLALLLRRSLLRGDEAPFVMELPPYRMPTVRAVLTRMGERSWLYLRKAGTVILGLSILLWTATSFPRLERTQIDADLEAGRLRLVTGANPGSASRPTGMTLAPATGKPRPFEVITVDEATRRRSMERLRHSAAGRLGLAMEPALRPLGFDWKLATAMVGAFAAKEVFVAQLGIIYSMGEVEEGSDALRRALRRDYSALTGFALMIFLLIAAPCMATLAVTRRESGSWRWAFLQFFGLTAVGYLAALLVQQVGQLLLPG